MDYTLYVPFGLGSNQTIYDVPYKKTIQYLHYELNTNHVKISGFQSESEAKAYINNLKLGFALIALRRKMGVTFNMDLQSIVYIEKEENSTINVLGKEIDVKGTKFGLLDENLSAIYSSDIHMQILRMGNVEISISNKADDIFNILNEGLTIDNKKVLESEKLETALEIFYSHYNVNSTTAKFLYLVMALETLTKAKKKHVKVLELLNKWKEQIIAIEANENDEVLLTDLDSLKREIDFRSGNSLRSQIRDLVYSVLSFNDPEALIKAREAVKLYDKRSTIVHGATLEKVELLKSINQLRSIVENVLINIITTGIYLE
jgi:hypothetical protein